MIDIAILLGLLAGLAILGTKERQAQQELKPVPVRVKAKNGKR